MWNYIHYINTQLSTITFWFHYQRCRNADKITNCRQRIHLNCRECWYFLGSALASTLMQMLSFFIHQFCRDVLNCHEIVVVEIKWTIQSFLIICHSIRKNLLTVWGSLRFYILNHEHQASISKLCTFEFTDSVRPSLFSRMGWVVFEEFN